MIQFLYVILKDAFGLLIQLPNNEGKLRDPDSLIRVADVYKCMKIAVVDPMAQVLMKPVGEMGFDIAVGSMQRFGVPMGFGGPHAAFFATTDKHKEKSLRIVGQSVDSQGNPALRLALQREQHIREIRQHRIYVLLKHYLQIWQDFMLHITEQKD